MPLVLFIIINIFFFCHRWLSSKLHNHQYFICYYSNIHTYASHSVHISAHNVAVEVPMDRPHDYILHLTTSSKQSPLVTINMQTYTTRKLEYKVMVEMTTQLLGSTWSWFYWGFITLLNNSYSCQICETIPESIFFRHPTPPSFLLQNWVHNISAWYS